MCQLAILNTSCIYSIPIAQRITRITNKYYSLFIPISQHVISVVVILTIVRSGTTLLIFDSEILEHELQSVDDTNNVCVSRIRSLVRLSCINTFLSL